MARAARCLADAVDGFLVGHHVLICDRDSKWTDDLRRIVQGAGMRIVLMPVRAPNANAYAELFVRSIRRSVSTASSSSGNVGCSAPSTSSSLTIIENGLTKGPAMK